MKKRKRKLTSEQAFTRLCKAAADYIETHGGRVTALGRVHIQRWPGELKHNFMLAIRVTGVAPKTIREAK